MYLRNQSPPLHNNPKFDNDYSESTPVIGITPSKQILVVYLCQWKPGDYYCMKWRDINTHTDVDIDYWTDDVSVIRIV